MKFGRSKNARKTLKFFDLNGNTRPPYKIIVDGNFLAAVVKQKVPLHDRLSDTFRNKEFTLYVCRSALNELSLLPGDLFQQARQYGLDECEILMEKSKKIDSSSSGNNTRKDTSQRDETNETTNNQHEKTSTEEESSSPHDDILTLLNIKPDQFNREYQADREHPFNPQGYIIATQDDELAKTLRSLPKIPMMRIMGRGVLFLESPSIASKRQSVWEERGKQIAGGMMNKAVSEEERGWIDKIKQEKKQERLEQVQQDRVDQRRQYSYQERKKRKARNPNPLSCKKKKTDDKKSNGTNNVEAQSDQKRKRRKKSKKATSTEE